MLTHIASFFFFLSGILYMQHRIRKATEEGVPAIDMHGSYFARKIQKL